MDVFFEKYLDHIQSWPEELSDPRILDGAQVYIALYEEDTIIKQCRFSNRFSPMYRDFQRELWRIYDDIWQ